MRTRQRTLIVGAGSFSGLQILEHFLVAGLSVRAVVYSQEEARGVKETFSGSHFPLLDAEVRVGNDLKALKVALTATPAMFDTVVYVSSPTSNFDTMDTYRDLVNSVTAAIVDFLLTVKETASGVNNVIVSTTTSIMGSWILDRELSSQAVFARDINGEPVYLEDVCSEDYLSACDAGVELVEEDLRAFMINQKPEFTLTTLIAPSIFGPHVRPSAVRLRGNMGDDWSNASSSCVELAYSNVQYLDVRDFASAHVQAATITTARGNTFALSSGQLTYCHQSLKKHIAGVVDRMNLWLENGSSRPRATVKANPTLEEHLSRNPTKTTLALRPRRNVEMKHTPERTLKHQPQPRRDDSSLVYAFPTNVAPTDFGMSTFDHTLRTHTSSPSHNTIASASALPLHSRSRLIPAIASPPSIPAVVPPLSFPSKRRRLRDSGIDLTPLWIPNTDISPMTSPIGTSYTRKGSIVTSPPPGPDRIRRLSVQNAERMHVHPSDMCSAPPHRPCTSADRTSDLHGDATGCGLRGRAWLRSDVVAMAVLKGFVREVARDVMSDAEGVAKWDTRKTAALLGLSEYRSLEQTLEDIVMQTVFRA